MKPTPTQWLLTVASLIAFGITQLGCLNFPRRTINEGAKRPVLSIAKVKADKLAPYPGREHIPWESPLLEVSFKNDGKTSARLTSAEPEVDLLSGDCDLRLDQTEKVRMNIAIWGERNCALEAAIGIEPRLDGLFEDLIPLSDEDALVMNPPPYHERVDETEKDGNA